jgi:hypothetical protein
MTAPFYLPRASVPSLPIPGGLSVKKYQSLIPVHNLSSMTALHHNKRSRGYNYIAFNSFAYASVAPAWQSASSLIINGL